MKRLFLAALLLPAGLLLAQAPRLGQTEFLSEESVKDGLGPLFNAPSCVACHNHPTTGGGSVVTELRVGKVAGGVYSPSLLIHARSTHPDILPYPPDDYLLRGLRISPPLFGLGLVEQIDSAELLAYAQQQPVGMRGEVHAVPVLEAPLDKKRAGRFGWKSQHASLISFSADAYLNELGITSPLLPRENTSVGRDVSAYDPAPDPEDTRGTLGFGRGVESFAAFIRGLPPPAPARAEPAGRLVFGQLGCGVCHREEYTAPQTFRPYSDFALHDVGTGDGLLQGGPQTTAFKFRTAPLWGLRFKNRLRHDGAWLTVNEAVLGHGGEAAGVTLRYTRLAPAQRDALLTFLRSL